MMVSWQDVFACVAWKEKTERVMYNCTIDQLNESTSNESSYNGIKYESDLAVA